MRNNKVMRHIRKLTMAREKNMPLLHVKTATLLSVIKAFKQRRRLRQCRKTGQSLVKRGKINVLHAFMHIF